MKMILTLSLLVLSSIALANTTKTKLECYETFYGEILSIDLDIISEQIELHKDEDTLLDQIFNPERYTHGLRNRYTSFKKADSDSVTSIIGNKSFSVFMSREKCWLFSKHALGSEVDRNPRRFTKL